MFFCVKMNKSVKLNARLTYMFNLSPVYAQSACEYMWTGEGAGDRLTLGVFSDCPGPGVHQLVRPVNR